MSLVLVGRPIVRVNCGRGFTRFDVAIFDTHYGKVRLVATKFGPASENAYHAAETTVRPTDRWLLRFGTICCGAPLIPLPIRGVDDLGRTVFYCANCDAETVTFMGEPSNSLDGFSVEVVGWSEYDLVLVNNELDRELLLVSDSRSLMGAFGASGLLTPMSVRYRGAYYTVTFDRVVEVRVWPDTPPVTESDPWVGHLGVELEITVPLGAPDRRQTLRESVFLPLLPSQTLLFSPADYDYKIYPTLGKFGGKRFERAIRAALTERFSPVTVVAPTFGGEL